MWGKFIYSLESILDEKSRRNLEKIERNVKREERRVGNVQYQHNVDPCQAGQGVQTAVTQEIQAF